VAFLAAEPKRCERAMAGIFPPVWKIQRIFHLKIEKFKID
jgi:hypothetical protein